MNQHEGFATTTTTKGQTRLKYKGHPHGEASECGKVWYMELIRGRGEERALTMITCGKEERRGRDAFNGLRKFDPPQTRRLALNP